MEWIQVADAARAVDLKNSLVASAFVVLYYDYLLTLPEEIELYWRRGERNFAWGPLFFFLNRYMALVGHIPVAVEYYAQLRTEQCRSLQFYHQLFSAISAAVVTILFILRTYALYAQSHIILMILLGIALVVLSVSCWALLIGQHAKERPDGVISSLGLCDLTLSTVDARFCAIAWSTVLVFDTVIFGLTIRQRARAGHSRGSRLFHLVVRDGTIYFGILSVIYTIDILTFLLTTSVHKGITVVYTNVFSSILMNRMMLNIRNPRSLSGSGQAPGATSVGIFSSIAFARSMPEDGPTTTREATRDVTANQLAAAA